MLRERSERETLLIKIQRWIGQSTQHNRTRKLLEGVATPRELLQPQLLADRQLRSRH